MRAPTEDERMVCPRSGTGTAHPPERVWDAPSPEGPKTYGIFKRHRHFSDKLARRDCEYSGLVGVVRRVSGGTRER